MSDNTLVIIVFLSIVVLIVLFVGDPDLHDALLGSCK